MAVNYTVRASVVDIRADAPRATDSFLVDTNVWFWLVYSPATNQRYASADYENYVKLVFRVKAKLFRCELSMTELAHQIENAERETYERAHATQKPATFPGVTGWLKPKEFRHNFPVERSIVAAQTRTAWHNVKNMAPQSLGIPVDDATTEAALTRFQTQPLDGYDLLMVENMAKAGVVQVLTDDGDFCTVPGIQMFTANPRVVAAAFAQGKSLKR
jgi:predicted nucleic acid-binding protein